MVGGPLLRSHLAAALRENYAAVSTTSVPMVEVVYPSVFASNLSPSYGKWTENYLEMQSSLLACLQRRAMLFRRKKVREVQGMAEDVTLLVAQGWSAWPSL